jgi:hypothetical protein
VTSAVAKADSRSHAFAGGGLSAQRAFSSPIVNGKCRGSQHRSACIAQSTERGDVSDTEEAARYQKCGGRSGNAPTR